MWFFIAYFDQKSITMYILSIKYHLWRCSYTLNIIHYFVSLVYIWYFVSFQTRFLKAITVTCQYDIRVIHSLSNYQYVTIIGSHGDFLLISILYNLVMNQGHSNHLNPYAAGGKFGHYIIHNYAKTWKIIETLAYWYSSDSTQCKLSYGYQHDKV